MTNFNLNQLTKNYLTETDKEKLTSMSNEELMIRKKWYISRKKYKHAQFCANLIISRSYEKERV